MKKHTFNRFKSSTSGIELPERFTFPFYYEPHPLCVIAAQEVQTFIEEQKDWKHNFGFDPNNKIAVGGKMFGVLIVKNNEGEIGYLSAYSGKLNDTERPDCFVPHVYNLPVGENFFTKGMLEINELGVQIRALKASPEMAKAKTSLENTKAIAAEEIEAYREEMRKAKKNRKALRDNNKSSLSELEFEKLKDSLVRESLHMRHELRLLVAKWDSKVNADQEDYFVFKNNHNNLVEERAKCSAKLQQQIFDNYKFLNVSGETKSLNNIFKNIEQPPAGAGDCAAPKLLHYAFTNQLKPLAMAEFWWGVSPTTTIRKHKNFYPACKNKCQPILKHMLLGLDMDPNPMLVDHGQHKKIETVYEDDFLLVINKPFGLLSVPGKEISDSVATRVKLKYPDATGPMVVHRLDMATSGLLLIAKSLEVHKHLQSQFLKRTIKKRYVALLDGELQKKDGVIDLPLRVDLDNRPSQMVCYDHGKRAITRFEVVESKSGKTRVHLYPHTGRTHQLRMHAAHQLGLNAPIIGDALYGIKSNRLHLHADYLQFEHPITLEKIRVKAEAEF